MNVLFMDDDEEHRLLGRRWLKINGHRAIVVANGKEALTAAAKHKLDWAIIDVMGEVDKYEGLNTARLLKADNPDIRIVLMSSGARPTIDFPFVTKPYDIEEIFRLLTKGEDFTP
jgi:CheY-like chemotaxis protein